VHFVDRPVEGALSDLAAKFKANVVVIGNTAEKVIDQ